MKYRVYETRIIEVSAKSKSEAERKADEIDYDKWEIYDFHIEYL